MKKKLKLQTEDGTVEVYIKTKHPKGTLTRDEQKHLIGALVDKIVPSMTSSPFISAFNHDVKVS